MRRSASSAATLSAGSADCMSPVAIKSLKLRSAAVAGTVLPSARKRTNPLHDYEYTHEYEYEYLLSYTIHIMSNMQSYYSYSTHLKIILLILYSLYDEYCE